MSNFFTEYDRLPLSTNDGYLYLGQFRSASTKYVPGATEIHLEGRDENGRIVVHDGTCNQFDKAEGICLRWLEKGEVASNFYPNKE